MDRWVDTDRHRQTYRQTPTYIYTERHNQTYTQAQTVTYTGTDRRTQTDIQTDANGHTRSHRQTHTHRQTYRRTLAYTDMLKTMSVDEHDIVCWTERTEWMSRDMQRPRLDSLRRCPM